ncbi:FG-GAP-like repeat-containing protein [Chryseolinea sp. H1M3-3]|uniref:FG-GAP-like repeat-containing protein n=1 Tax=Chryseolinea sp. H1M3-3 TaxID=3034144 RepID=UPI0023EC7447|nr:FG-GAP-like repeat-containing protein [Chryseolinea sp. H1M3-3]
MPLEFTNERHPMKTFACLPEVAYFDYYPTGKRLSKLTVVVLLLITAIPFQILAQTFQEEEPAIPTNYSSRYHWADFDGDGDTDALEFGYQYGGILHTRTGNSFSAASVDVPGSFLTESVNFKLNDYDHDHDLDILFARYNDVAIAVNAGDNTFTIVTTNIAYNDNEYGPTDWQDIDGDLDLDVVHNRKIYLNDNGTYRESLYKLTEEIRTMVWGDINNDGLIDILATAGYDQWFGNPLQIYLNQGGGNFQPLEKEFGMKVRDRSGLLLFDANNDGKLDILAMDVTKGKCYVIANTSGSEQLQFALPYSIGSIAVNDATTGDLNGDGLADIVVAAYSYTDNEYQTMVFVNATTSNLSFSKTNSFEATEFVNALHLIDYDNDNDLDIHTKFYNQNLSVETSTMLINTGTAAGSPPAVPSNLTTLVGTHVNLSWNGATNNVYNIEFKKNGQTIQITPTTASGKLLLTDNSTLISSSAYTVYNLPSGNYEWRVQAINKSRRTSAFSSTGTFEIGAAPSALTLTVNSKTSIDLCWSFAGNANSFIVFRRANNSVLEQIADVPGTTLCYTDGSLQKNQFYEYYVKAVTAGAHSAPSQTVGHHSSQFIPVSFGTHEPNIVTASAHPADYDLDGDYDIEFMGRISHNYGNDLNFKNDGTGNFTQMVSILPTLPDEFKLNRVVDAVDMDNDGDTDFCVILGNDYSRQKLAVLLNENGTLALAYQGDAYLALYQAGVADFNNDGRRDILYRHAVGNASGNPHVYELLLQTPDGNFTDSKFKFTDGDYGELGSFHIADLNNDGFMDICFVGTEYEPLRFFVNAGGMAFIKHTPKLPTTPVFFMDIDGDGITDYIGSSSDGYRWYKGSGNFQYAWQQLMHQSYGSYAIAGKAGDLDLDGLPDIIFTDGYRSSIAINKGGGSFEVSNVELDEHWDSSIAFTDMENDGDLDLVKLGSDDWHQGYNYFYLNQAEKLGATNTSPSVPTSLTAKFSFGNLTIGWQPSADDKTPANLLSYNLWITDATGKTWLHGETNASGLFRNRLAVGNAGNRTSHTIRDLPAGAYKIRVQALDAAFASSPWSAELPVTIDHGPTNLNVERILLNKIKLSWTGSSFQEQHVVIERKLSESPFETIAELPAGSTSFIDENLSYNKQYQYRVTEVSNGTSTSPSNVVEWSTMMWTVEETTLPNIYGSLDIADYTQDGKMDILLNGGRIYNSQYAELTRAAFENTGSGWVKHDITPSELGTTASFKFFDVNGDHKPDLYQHGYIWNEGYKTEVFLNNGDKTFSPAINTFTQNAYGIQSRYDADMDNDVDLSVVDRANGDVKKFMRNDGVGNYTTEDPNCSGCGGVTATADFDADGDEDFIIYEGNSFALYLASPQGLINSGITFSTYENQIAVLDYNGDGLPDIALLTSSHYTSGKLYKNLGIKDGVLTFEMISSDLLSGENTFNVADFDHDGYQDIALISPYGTFYRNTGNGAFEVYQMPYYTFSLNQSGIIDFDNDGDLDVYVTGYINYQQNSYDQPFSRIFLNQIVNGGKGIKNAPPAAPSNLSAVQDSLGIHLGWRDETDDHTTASGMTHDVVIYRNGTPILKGPIDPVTGERQRLEPGTFTDKAILNNLTVGEYTWKVQAVDQSYLGSKLSAAGTFIFLPPPPLVNDTVVYRCDRSVTIKAKGIDIRWYRDRQKKDLIASGDFHPEKSQVVYVTQNVDGYEGIPRRIAITIYDTPPAPAANTLVTYCENYSGSLSLSASGQNIRWYGAKDKTQLLSNNAYFSVEATKRSYYVTQTLDGCESEPIAVTVTPITINTEIYGSENTLEVGEKDGDYYAWSMNGSYIFNSNSASIPYNGETGTYRVFVMKGGCSEYSRSYNMPADLITGIEDITDAGWSVYPNPARKYFSIDVGSLRGIVKIYEVTGRLVHTTTIDHPLGVIETYPIQLPAGVYLIIFEDGIVNRSKRVVVY